MGMAASQARYLSLTARRSDLEYESQQICQKRTDLANQMDALATEYADKINNRFLYFTSYNTQGETETTRLSYSDIVRSKEDMDNPGLGMRVVTREGAIVTPGEVSPADRKEGSSYLTDLNCLSSDYLESKLRTGEWALQKVDTSMGTPKWSNTSYTSIGAIEDLLYKEDDTSAEAEYEAKLSRVQSQDKEMELRQKEIETTHQTIETEIESVEKVIEKNIESSFKTFA